jgi:phage terminase large subunit-like protein
MVSDLFARGMVQAVGMDDYQLANLGKRFKEAGFPMYRLWSKEMASASSLIYSLFAAGSIQHNNDPLFIAQVGRGVARYTGESWRVSRRDSAGDIDALMSTIIAVYVANIRNADSIQVF